MTKVQYLEQLDYKLRVLPYAERQDALDYYDGYISDANSEELAIIQLGSPGEVAAVILADFVAKDTPVSDGESLYVHPRKNKYKTAWVIILALFAVPIGLPLVITVGATAFALFVSLVSVVFSLGVSGVATIVGGIIGLIAFPFILVQDVGSGLITAGISLACIGIGILFVRCAFYCVGGFTWIAKFVAKTITRRREYHGRPAIQQ
jgi:uncharacterized membrane protein